MKLHNSLTNKIETFSPISDPVRMYSCGPTVYNNLHIGNLSAFIYADMFRRALIANGYNVLHVMNITDVDDKTIRDSKRDYPEDEPLIALTKLTKKYTHIFMQDLQATGNEVDKMQFISAVDTIPEMIQLIQRLLDKGVAYQAQDGIYFSIQAYQDQGHTYGLLQHIEFTVSRSRITQDEYDKDNAHDFALWKATTPGEPFWDAAFLVDNKKVLMPGRPGWHIECSAMSEKLLGIPFDIHTGGIDLKFPHHENEIAQSCGGGSTEFSRYFIHNNHILVDGRKMSKSLGNFYTLRDIEDKGFNADCFRLVVLESHYRKESNFSWEILEAAKNRLTGWRTVSATMWQLSKEEPADASLLEIKSCLASDLDTPGLLAEIDKYLHKCTKNKTKPSKEFISTVHAATGINLAVSDISTAQYALISDRAAARVTQNWSLSDQLREELSLAGIGLLDSPEGQIWYWKQ